MKKEAFIVDRIEGDIIVIEDFNEQILHIDKNQVDKLPKEGDVLTKENGIYTIDNEATAERKNKIRDLMKGMWAD